MMESNHKNSAKREANGDLQEPKILKKLKIPFSPSSQDEEDSSPPPTNNEDDLSDPPELEEHSEDSEDAIDDLRKKHLPRKNKFDRNRKIFLRPKELEKEDVQGWYFTKKPVGIFAYWNGRELYSFSGCKYKPPSRFIKDFPEGYPLLGVLNKLRADLAEHRRIVCQKGETAVEWLDLKFSVYDTPEGDRKFKNRIEEIKSSLADGASYVELSKYKKLNSELDILYEIRKLEQKGEAIFFKHGEKPYLPGLGGGFLQLFPENPLGKSAIKRFCQASLAKNLNVKDLLL